MKLNLATADVLIPDGTPASKALARTTHLGIGAHQDDLEIMAFHGILACFGQPDHWFTGVTCTNGSGSPRAGIYANYTDDQMRTVRRTEQRTAAIMAHYAAMFQLDYPSAAVKDPKDLTLVEDLARILAATKPQVVYTHNLADKHDTHIACAVAAIQALRRLPTANRPHSVYGCEVWRDLDWLPAAAKIALDVSGRDSLAAALTGIFDSQITGGKRYDLATLGRRRANATYAESHGVDEADQIIFAMDLTPLVRDDTLDPLEYVAGLIREFEADVRKRVGLRLGGWTPGDFQTTDTGGKHGRSTKQ